MTATALPIAIPTPTFATSTWTDILAHAMTGELIASMNYTALAGICDDPEEIADAREHAEGESGHAAAFAAEGQKIGVTIKSNVDGKYWRRLRESFMRSVAERDFIGCLVIQEVMLESFAVASYERVGRVGPGTLGTTFTAIAIEEAGHIEHAMSILRAEREKDEEAFDAKVHRIHLDVMTTLAEMLAKEDPHGHCGVCQGNCIKHSLPGVGLTTAELRGAALQQYLKTLDMLGLPGEMTLAWVAKLPV
jgi:fatty aldehyde decarbonylase